MRILGCAVLAAIALGAAAPDPVAWKVQEAPGKPVKSGGRFTVKLLAKIENGWHMYGLKPVADGPIPTRIWIPEGQPARLVAPVQGTEPQTLQDPTLGMEVQIYEGEVSFTLPMRLTGPAGAGAQNLVVNASYQTCDNKICRPPKTVKIEVPMIVAR